MRAHPLLLASSFALATVGVAAFAFQSSFSTVGDGKTAVATGFASSTGQGPVPASRVAAALAPELPSTKPFVTRPPIAPCGVIEVVDLPISDYEPAIDFAATAPASCTGPLSKIVLELGHEFDGMIPRPMALGVWVDDVNLAFAHARVGDDPPSPWYVERDLTDYTAVFRPGAQGRIRLDPYALWDEPSLMMRVTLRIVFYPQGAGAAAPRKPDRVYALGPEAGGQAGLDWDLRSNSARVRLPRDIERVYVDVLAKSAGLGAATCVPRVVADALPDVVKRYPEPGVSGERCGDVPLDEIRVYVDGQIAGIAPMEPRAELHPAAPRALHPLPYRVDLSPFAGVLSDGMPHLLRFTTGLGDTAASVQTTATLLVYRDPHSTTVSGSVVRNTLLGTPAVPNVTHGLAQTGDHVTGSVRTVFNRHFLIEGYIDTARGRMWHRVVQDTHLDNRQQYDVRRPDPQAYRYQQATAMTYRTWRTSYTTLVGRQLRRDYEYLSYPLTMSELGARTGAIDTVYEERTEMAQGIHRHGEYDRARIAHYGTRLDERFSNYLYRRFDQATSVYDSRHASEYGYTDNRGSCYDAALISAQGTVEPIRGAGCPGGVNNVRWFARPDGEPESLGWAGYE